MEPFAGCEMANFFWDECMVSISWRTFLHVASQSLIHLYHVLIISLGSFQCCKLYFKLSSYWLWRDRVWNIPWTCCFLPLHIMTVRPGCLIRSIRTVLPDLPCPAPIALLILLFRARRIFSLSCQVPVRRLNITIWVYFQLTLSDSTQPDSSE